MRRSKSSKCRGSDAAHRLGRKKRANCPLTLLGLIAIGELLTWGSERGRQHFLYFFPLPQGHSSLRPIFWLGRSIWHHRSRLRSKNWATSRNFLSRNFPDGLYFPCFPYRLFLPCLPRDGKNANRNNSMVFDKQSRKQVGRLVQWKNIRRHWIFPSLPFRGRVAFP